MEAAEKFKKGFTGGMISSIICSPLDMVRTRLQLNEKWNLNTKMFKRSLIGCMASQPFFWGTFWSVRNVVPQSPIEPWISSSIASFFCNPLFVLRTKLQAEGSQTLVNEFMNIAKSPTSWYKGYGMTMVHNVQFIGIIPLQKRFNNYVDNTIFTSGLSKLCVGTLFYPLERARTLRRMDRLREFRFGPEIFRGYSAYILRTVPQTAIALGLLA